MLCTNGISGRYLLGLVATYGLAYGVERARAFPLGQPAVYTDRDKTWSEVRTCIIYGAQMVAAYCLMLLVMLYDTLIFIAVGCTHIKSARIWPVHAHLRCS